MRYIHHICILNFTYNGHLAWCCAATYDKNERQFITVVATLTCDGNSALPMLRSVPAAYVSASDLTEAEHSSLLARTIRFLIRPTHPTAGRSQYHAAFRLCPEAWRKSGLSGSCRTASGLKTVGTVRTVGLWVATSEIHPLKTFNLNF